MKKILVGVIILHMIFNVAAYIPNQHQGYYDSPAVLNYYYDTEKIKDINFTEGTASDGNYIWVLESSEQRIYKYWLNGTYAGFYNIYSRDADIIPPGGGGGQIIEEISIEVQEEESITPLFYEVNFNQLLINIKDFFEDYPYLIVIICFVIGIFLFAWRGINGRR